MQEIEQTLDSREVAEMVKIEFTISTLTERQMSPSELKSLFYLLTY